MEAKKGGSLTHYVTLTVDALESLKEKLYVIE